MPNTRGRSRLSDAGQAGSDDNSRLGNDGTKFYCLTNKNAPKYKVVAIDISKDGFPQEDLIPEDKDAVLGQAMIVADDKLALVYKRNVRERHATTNFNVHR